MENLSLIISVYKKIRELEILLNALRKQTCKNFDVIIADDGSGEEMKQFVENFSKTSDFKIKFITQEDKGFRKNIILNEAIKISDSEYLIFLDCDCIPHKDFVRAYFENIEPGTVLTGRRVNLSKKLSDSLDIDFVNSYLFDKFNMKAFCNSFGFKNMTSAAEEGFLIKNKFLRKLLNIRNNHIVGCNFLVPKSLMLEINGFDENYVGAGIGEDTDIEYRLSLINAKFKSVRNLAVVFHIFHSKTKEENTNYEYFHNNIKRKNVYFCENGIKKR
jgi:glycosyltransferase involved in cell wall biosynthesis